MFEEGKPQYRIECVHTFEDFKRLFCAKNNITPQMSFGIAVRSFAHVLLCLAALFCFGYGVYFVWLALNGVPEVTAQELAFILFAAFVLLALRLVTCYTDRLVMKKGWSKYPYQNKPVSYCFYDDVFYELVNGEEEPLFYSMVWKVLEDRCRYYLFIDDTFAYILPKAAFSVGDATSFATFISEKLGCKVRRFW